MFEFFSLCKSNMNTIGVFIACYGAVKVNFNSNTTAEDVIIDMCEKLKIGPVARHLFALRIISTKAWLCLSTKIEEISNRELELRVRFKVPDLSRLERIDLNAYNYYFCQVRREILLSKVPNLDFAKYGNKIIGLGVIDMYRATIEAGWSKNEVIKKYRLFFPREAKKKHWFYLKKPIVTMLNEIESKFKEHFNKVVPNANDENFEDIKLKCELSYIKSGYLEQFAKIAPNYLSENFNALINDVDRPYGVQINVNPFHQDFPGLSMKCEHKEEWEHICTIDDLCYLNIGKEAKERTIEISRRNGIPVFLKFRSLPDMCSFISLLDGYYKLMVKWTFNLCRDFPTPSLEKLLPLKCHGPISGKFAYSKLQKKRNNEVGCYILRESDSAYNAYYIDVCTKTSAKPVTYKIETTINEQFRLCGGKKTYETIPQLIADHKSGDSGFMLRECLPPSEFDQSNLLICRVEDGNCNQTQSLDEKELPGMMPLCINTRSLMVYKNKLKEGRSTFTKIYRGVWTAGKHKRNVAIKVLKENFKEKCLTEFLSLSNEWAFVNSNAIVKFYGFTLSSPTSMVMEYLPLGQLDRYLADVGNRPPIQEVDLVQASTYLANALWYLEEAGFVHGKIRCRKLFVSAHTDDSFEVKLSDPGLFSEFTDTDIHWIPPECYSDLMQVRVSHTSDVWAFGTTLWEIFSYGKCPPAAEASELKEFYRNGKILPKPNGCSDTIYHLMMECWNRDPYIRKKPQAAMRDINQVLYQVFNARRTHSYSVIIPTRINKQDNVSSKSEESEELTSSLSSELTDDGDEGSSMELSQSSATLNNDTMPDKNNTMPDKNDTMPDKNDTMPDKNDTMPDKNDTMPDKNDTMPDKNDTMPDKNDTMPDKNDTMPDKNDTMPDENDTMPDENDTMPDENDHSEMYQFFTKTKDCMPDNEHKNSPSDNPITSIQSIFELDSEWNMILIARIGEGYYGEVFKGMLQHWHCEEETQEVAIKKLKSDTLTRDKLADFDREISIMKKLDHPNIVRIKGTIRDPELCLVLEYIEHGSLRCYLNIYKDQLTTNHLIKFALDVAKGMAYLSEKKIVHRDLAARNILVVDEHNVKISDFGLAQFVDSNNYYMYRTERHLPLEWYAPESIQSGKFSPQSDVWSYGVTLYEMFSYGENPRLPITNPTPVRICEALKNEIRLSPPTKCPYHVYHNIMRECWKFEAKERPTFKQLTVMLGNYYKPRDKPKPDTEST